MQPEDAAQGERERDCCSEEQTRTIGKGLKVLRNAIFTFVTSFSNLRTNLPVEMYFRNRFALGLNLAVKHFLVLQAIVAISKHC